MKYGVIFLVVFFAVGCASKNKVSLDEPEKFEKNLNVSTNDKSEKVGIRNNDVVIQKRIYLEEELSKLQIQISDLENGIYGRSKKDPGGLYASLQKCRKKISDPRLGGDGNVEVTEKWEKMSEKDEDYKYAVDDKNNVVAYSEEALETRIANLKKLRRVLDEKYDFFKDKNEVCESKYRTALINHGIKPEDTQAQGEWVDGPSGDRVWKMKRSSSDDPEELMKRKAEREKSGK